MCVEGTERGRERERDGEREGGGSIHVREKHGSVVDLTHPDRISNLKPRYLP